MIQADRVQANAVMTRRLVLGTAVMTLVTGCAGSSHPTLSPDAAPPEMDGVFTMDDGASLPYRVWRPDGSPRCVALALHGFNDSRDAFEVPSDYLTKSGILIYAPDQRGFGAAPGRGLWFGADRMALDAALIVRQLACRHAGVPIVAIGESMGGAVLLHLGATMAPREISAYVLAAPAVWGRGEMDLFLRSGLWLVSHTIPDWTVTGGGPIKVLATDNIPALRRLSTDQLTLHTTRFGSLRGLVDLMDSAQAASARIAAPTLWLYGAKDQLVPKEATLKAWSRLPQRSSVRLAYYPNDYHLILRDYDRSAPLGDIVAWLGNPASALPSGADVAAAAWWDESV